MRASPASRRMEPLSHYNNEILIALKKKKKEHWKPPAVQQSGEKEHPYSHLD